MLTAAHCLVDTESVVVGYGNVDRTETKKIKSAKVIVNPAYLDGQKADLALVKLSEPIDDAPVVALADASSAQSLLQPGAKATVTGWGAIWDFQAFNNAMDVMAGRRTLSERRLLNDEELQAPRREQVIRRRRMRAVDGHDVHARQHLVEALPIGRLEFLLERRRDPLAVVIVDLQAKRLGALRDGLADAAHADDAEPLAEDAVTEHPGR